MKKKPAILLVVVILTAVAVCIWYSKANSRAVLVFKGYEPSATNSTQIAKFELQNKTGSPIWIMFAGPPLSLEPQFLKRPIVIVPAPTNDIEPVSVTSYTEIRKKILPSEKLTLDFPMAAGAPAEQVGVRYYTGYFKSGSDFLNSLSEPILKKDANLKTQIKFHFRKMKDFFTRSKSHEIWCPQPVSFPDEKPQTPPR